MITPPPPPPPPASHSPLRYVQQLLSDRSLLECAALQQFLEFSGKESLTKVSHSSLCVPIYTYTYTYVTLHSSFTYT